MILFNLGPFVNESKTDVSVNNLDFKSLNTERRSLASSFCSKQPFLPHGEEVVRVKVYTSTRQSRRKKSKESWEWYCSNFTEDESEVTASASWRKENDVKLIPDEGFEIEGSCYGTKRRRFIWCTCYFCIVGISSAPLVSETQSWCLGHVKQSMIFIVRGFRRLRRWKVQVKAWDNHVIDQRISRGS